MKIIQDLKLIQNLINKFPDTGNQLNIFMIGNIRETDLKNETIETKNNAILFDLEDYLENLPQPRLKNLVKNAVAIAIRRCSTEIEAGKWLGGSRRLIQYRKQKTIMEEKENEKKIIDS